MAAMKSRFSALNASGRRRRLNRRAPRIELRVANSEIRPARRALLAPRDPDADESRQHEQGQRREATEAAAAAAAITATTSSSATAGDGEGRAGHGAVAHPTH